MACCYSSLHIHSSVFVADEEEGEEGEESSDEGEESEEEEEEEEEISSEQEISQELAEGAILLMAQAHPVPPLCTARSESLLSTAYLMPYCSFIPYFPVLPLRPCRATRIRGGGRGAQCFNRKSC